MTNICETCQVSVSALLDGELETAEILPTLDHLVGIDRIETRVSQCWRNAYKRLKHFFIA